MAKTERPHSVPTGLGAAASVDHETPSIDPIVADVHAIRAQQWAQYGDNTQAWFNDLLQHQAQRMHSPSLAI